jgi:hypothetical protein
MAIIDDVHDNATASVQRELRLTGARRMKRKMFIINIIII